jgi:small-conductance mechanosensitive channel
MTLRPVSRALALAALAVAFASGAPAGEPTSSEEGLPVKLEGEVVFRLENAYHGTVSPGDSVRIAEERLLRVAQDPFYAPGLITTQKTEDGVYILYRGAVMGLITSKAAARLGMTAEERAAHIVTAVEEAVERYRERRQPEEWTRSIVLLGLATLIFAAGLWLVYVVHRRAAAWVTTRSQAGSTLGGHRLGFRNAERLRAFELRLLRIGRALIVLLVALLYLQAAFAIVPVTRGYALGVLAYLTDPLRIVWKDFIRNIGDLFFIAVVVVLARLLLRGIRSLLTEAALGVFSLPGIPRYRALPLYKIVRLAVIAITVVMIYPYIPGSSTAAFQGISLFAGALFTLGASSTASNFIGGMVLIFSGAFQVGDRVKIGDVTGDVEESTLALTRLRTTKNELVTFANGAVLNASFVNYSALARKHGLVVHTGVTIGYAVPWRKVHELLIRAAGLTQGALEEPAPFVLQTSLDDSYVAYEINLYTREANALQRIRSELHEHIQDIFAEAGVEILSPAYRALRDGRASTLPPQEADPPRG